MSQRHQLRSKPQNIHWGFFDAALPPVLEVDSGDTVTVECLTGLPQDVPNGGFQILPDLLQVHQELTKGPGNHMMTGPIAVRNARIGDVLEVRIRDIQLRQDWAWNRLTPLGGALPEDFPVNRLVHFRLDAERMIGHLPWGGVLPLRPFFGVVAVAPPKDWGRVTSVIPHKFGGNLDIKELVAGSTVYLPIFNDGALFSVGDGHAAQGDGEVAGGPFETALRGTFELVLRKDIKLSQPRAETPEHYITIGTDPDLDDAAKTALRDMIALIQEKAGLSREDAYILCSIAADLRVSQLVNTHKGIHALLAKTALNGPEPNPHG